MKADRIVEEGRGGFSVDGKRLSKAAQKALDRKADKAKQLAEQQAASRRRRELREAKREDAGSAIENRTSDSSSPSPRPTIDPAKEKAKALTEETVKNLLGEYDAVLKTFSEAVREIGRQFKLARSMPPTKRENHRVDAFNKFIKDAQSFLGQIYQKSEVAYKTCLAKANKEILSVLGNINKLMLINTLTMSPELLSPVLESGKLKVLFEESKRMYEEIKQEIDKLEIKNSIKNALRLRIDSIYKEIKLHHQEGIMLYAVKIKVKEIVGKLFSSISDQIKSYQETVKDFEAKLKELLNMDKVHIFLISSIKRVWDGRTCQRIEKELLQKSSEFVSLLKAVAEELRTMTDNVYKIEETAQKKDKEESLTMITKLEEHTRHIEEAYTQKKWDMVSEEVEQLQLLHPSLSA